MAVFSPSSEARAIGVASLQAGLIGSVLAPVVFASAWLLSGNDLGTFYDFLLASGEGDAVSPPATPTILDFIILIGIAGLSAVAAAVIFGFIPGTVTVGVFLLVFGLPLASAMQREMANVRGLAFALLAASVIVGFLAAAVVGKEFAAIALCYAIPAAIFYRRQILLERVLD